MSYQTRTQMLSSWLALESQHPGLISHEILGQSCQGRNILLFKIGNPLGGRVWFNGCTHGGEIVGPECYFLYAKWLLEDQEPGVSDRILNRNYTLILPMLNIDGYPDNNNGAGPVPLGPLTEGRRDNRNPLGGVNLNRNFPKSWRSDAGVYDPALGHWRGEPTDASLACVDPLYPTKIGRDPVFYCYKSGASCAWTDKPDDWEYRGAGPGSEPEAQALIAGVTKWQPKFFLDYHTWGTTSTIVGQVPYICKSKYITGAAGTYAQAVLDRARALAQSKGTDIVEYRGTSGYILSEGVCGAVIDTVWDICKATCYLTENPGPYDSTTCCDRLKDYTTWVTNLAWPKFLPLAIQFSLECEVVSTPVTLTVETTINGSTNPPPSTVTYNQGEDAIITAYADAGFNFDYWLIDNVRPSSPADKSNPLMLQMADNHTVKPVFAAAPPPSSDSMLPLLLLAALVAVAFM